MAVWSFDPDDVAPAATAQTFALDGTRNGILYLGNGLFSWPRGYRSEGSGFATAPAPVASVLHDGTTGVAYSETISAVNGTPPYSFAITGGALPTSLSMSSSGGISGTPSAAGTFTFVVQVTDSGSLVGTQSFSITVSAPSSGGGEVSHTFVC